MTMDRSVFVDHFEGEYKSLKTRLDEFKLKMHLGGMEARDLKKKLVDELHHGLETARLKLHDVRKSSNEGYRKLMYDTERLWHELGDRFKKAADHFHHEEEESKR